jgi:hypothetical protein
MSIKPDGEQITSSFVLLLSSSLLLRASARGILFFWLFQRCRTGGWRETRLVRSLAGHLSATLSKGLSQVPWLFSDSFVRNVWQRGKAATEEETVSGGGNGVRNRFSIFCESAGQNRWLRNLS